MSLYAFAPSPVFLTYDLRSGTSRSGMPLFRNPSLLESFRRSSSLDGRPVLCLDGADLLAFLVDVHHRGIDEIAIDPRSSDAAEQAPARVAIQSLLDEAGLVATTRLYAALPNPAARGKIHLFRCPQCGAVIEQRVGQSAPQCCGQSMHVHQDTG